MKPVWRPWPTFHADPLDIFRPPCSFAISRCSRTMLRHLSLPWATDVLLCWPTKEHDMRLVFVINLCVLEQTLQELNAYSYLERSQTEICCVLVKAHLPDWKFSFQNNCKHLVRLYVVSINLPCQIFACVTPTPLQITGCYKLVDYLEELPFLTENTCWVFVASKWLLGVQVSSHIHVNLLISAVP